MADRAGGNGSSDAVMPSGSTSGSKLISRAIAGFLGLYLSDGDSAGIDGPPRLRPRFGGVVGRIARLTNRENQPPLQRPLCHRADEVVEKIILAMGWPRNIQPRRHPAEPRTSAPEQWRRRC